MSRMTVLAVHGGVGPWKNARRNRVLAGVREACETGYRVLATGGTATDAVEEAVAVMEDDPTFNAGLGSALSLDGRVEMDASIMEGRALRAGAVALIRSIRNPVRLARVVMEETSYVFMAGVMAEALGESLGLELIDPVIPARLEQWRKAAFRSPVSKLVAGLGDTVGAVALDPDGNLAAATSTGGLFMKPRGRVGDSAVIGAGIYADNRGGAASATGLGEVALRLVLAKKACDLMTEGKTARAAARRSIDLVNQRISGPMGLLALDRLGRIAAVHNRERMCWGFMRGGMKAPKCFMRGILVT